MQIMKNTQSASNQPNSIRYSRHFDRWQALLRGLGVMIILSAFILIGQTAAIAGHWTPLSFFLAILLLAPNILTYAELAVSVPCTGGAYVQVHESRDGWLAFLTGWVLVIATLSVGVILAQAFAAQVAVLLQDHFNLTISPWPWALGLIIISSISNALGTQKPRREFLISILLGVLVGIVCLSIPAIQFSHYTIAPSRSPISPATSRPSWEQALPLLLLLFVGFEMMMSFRSGSCLRGQSFSKILVITLLLAALMITCFAIVAVGVLGSDTLSDSSTPLALLGDRAAPGVGRPLILIVGSLALILIFNRIFLLIVRQTYRMNKDGYFPAGLRKHPQRFQTPIWIICLVALLQLSLLIFPPAFLGQLASLLYLVVMMIINVTLLRRKQAASAEFTLPFHPWVPSLTLSIDVLISLLWPPLYLAWAGGLIGLGVLFYVIYARNHHLEAREGITVFKPSPEEKPRAEYRVMTPIANPATVDVLLRLAGVLARQKNGEVLALQIVTVPDQIPLEEGRYRARASRVLLEQAIAQAQEENFEIQTITRVAHNVAQGILDTAREENVDLILMGWRGYTYSFGASMGPIIDAVMKDAPCDVVVAKGDQWRTAKKILVPTSGGPHASIAAELATTIASTYDSEITALYVQVGRATSEQMAANRQRLEQTLNGIEFTKAPEQKIIVTDSIVKGIVEEAKDYDLILLGASEERMFDQFVFGNIPQRIAAQATTPAIIARRYGGPTDFWIRRLVHSLRQTFPSLDSEEQLTFREELTHSAQPGINYFVLIVLSSIIATLGLLLNSAAVVIGAMLVAPLMSPILAFSLGMVLGDVRLIRRSIEAVSKGIALAIVLAIFIGILSPFKGLTTEIMARTQPTLLDLAVALASGMAGAYALARKDVSAALPGVAIAAALMPPLGVVGLGLSLGKPHVAGGALLLFITNISAISLAGVLVFVLLGVRPQNWQPDTERRIRRSIVGFTLLLMVIAIPLIAIMSGIIQDARTQETIRQVLQTHATAQDGILVEFEYQLQPDDSLAIAATIRSTKPADQIHINETAQILQQRLNRSVTLEVIVFPVIRSTNQ
jgi:uncharacterized hydrophobic protein (TIGR00271 family)